MKMVKLNQVLIRIALAAAVTAAICPASFAQTLNCSDFKLNDNGSWSPVRAIQIGSVTMGPGVSFTPGVQFGGVDLATILNQKCR
jgi:hypothetical protein